MTGRCVDSHKLRSVFLTPLSIKSENHYIYVIVFVQFGDVLIHLNYTSFFLSKLKEGEICDLKTIEMMKKPVV